MKKKGGGVLIKIDAPMTFWGVPFRSHPPILSLASLSAAETIAIKDIIKKQFSKYI
jgi:hypothetical protein